MKGGVCMTKRHSYGYVKEFVEKEGYKLISTEYINNKVPITVQCDKGHEPYEVRFANFKSGKRCPECAIIKRNESKRISPDKVKDMVEEAGYTLLKIIEGSKGSHKRLVVKCDKGHEPYEVTYQNFSKGRRCPYCKADKNRTPIEEVRAVISREGFTLLSDEYKSRKHKIKVRCPQGHDYITTYDLFLAGKRCGRCSMSKGERLIYFILKNVLVNNDFIYQYDVKINNTIYRYDFCVYADKKLFIEFDGIHHYKPVDGFGGEEGFIDCKKWDNIKNKYVEDNKEHCELLRVPYFYNDIKIYNTVIDYLRRHKVMVEELNDLSVLEKAKYIDTRAEDIANYYLTHSVKDTKRKFGVEAHTVYRSFRRIYGKTKSQYLEDLN